MKKVKTRVLPRDRKVIGIDLGGTLSKIAVYVPKKKLSSFSSNGALTNSNSKINNNIQS